MWLGFGFLPALMLPASVSAVEKIQVLALFKNKAVVLLDGKRRLLKAGVVSPEGVMLISADSAGMVLEIDGKQKSYGLGTHIGSSFNAPRERAVQIWPTANKMYTIVGSINGYPVDFVVDTGATFISFNEPQAKRLGIDYRVTGKPGTSSTASGFARVYMITLKRVKIGELELTNVGALVHDGNFPQIALLGMSFLSRVDMHREGAMLELRQKF